MRFATGNRQVGIVARLAVESGLYPLFEAEHGAVVSVGVAERLWPGADPLGQTIELGEEAVGYRVVGVVPDQAHDGIDGTPDAN